MGDNLIDVRATIHWGGLRPGHIVPVNAKQPEIAAAIKAGILVPLVPLVVGQPQAEQTRKIIEHASELETPDQDDLSLGAPPDVEAEGDDLPEDGHALDDGGPQ